MPFDFRIPLVTPSLLTFLCSCADPSLPPRGSSPASPAGIDGVVSVSLLPIRPDGRASRSTRISITLGRAAAADVARPGRAVLVGGGADAAEVAAIAKSRASASLRGRQVPLFSWGEPADQPTQVHVQPAEALPPGRSTLVFLIDRQPPYSTDVHVVDERPPAGRVWPIGAAPTTTTTTFTYCTLSRALPLLRHSTFLLSPQGTTVQARVRTDAPCVEFTPTASLSPGTYVLPPALGDDAWPIDPMAVTVNTAAPPALPAARCGAPEVALGPICARIDDDRITFLGSVDRRHAIFGTIGSERFALALDIGSRSVVRQLRPASTLHLSATIRGASGDFPLTTSLSTAPSRRHVVINELLAHPPSGSPSQRFVELVNDGRDACDTGGLILRDGERTIELPSTRLPAGGFILVTPQGYVDGLAGDASPPSETPRIRVDELQLRGAVQLVDSGRVVSQFPGNSSTKSASRGRPSPETPDDTPGAFGWDSTDRATPGRPNSIVP